MYLPLSIDTVLGSTYKISSHIKRIASHNVYDGLNLVTGSRVIINEFVPDYCRRGKDLAISCEDSMADSYKSALCGIESDAAVIKVCELNDRLLFVDCIRDFNTVYLICDNENKPPVYDVTELTNFSFERLCTLFLKFTDFAISAGEKDVSAFPSLENIGAAKDDFRLCYVYAPEHEPSVVIKSLCNAFFTYAYGKNYSLKNAPATKKPDHKLEIFSEMIVSGIESGYPGNLEQFRNEFKALYNATAQGGAAVSKRAGMILFISAVITVIVLAAGIFIGANALISYVAPKTSLPTLTPEPVPKPVKILFDYTEEVKL